MLDVWHILHWLNHYWFNPTKKGYRKARQNKQLQTEMCGAPARSNSLQPREGHWHYWSAARFALNSQFSRLSSILGMLPFLFPFRWPVLLGIMCCPHFKTMSDSLLIEITISHGKSWIFSPLPSAQVQWMKKASTEETWEWLWPSLQWPC